MLPKWQHRAIVDITRQDVRQLVEHVAEAGAPIVANRVAALLSKLFAFALDRDLVHRRVRPYGFRGRARNSARSRADGRRAAGALACPSRRSSAPMAAFYKLRLLTAQRGGEVAAMRWQDIDLEAGWWTIPAALEQEQAGAPRAAQQLSAARSLAATVAGRSAATYSEARLRASEAPARVASASRPKRRRRSPSQNFRGHDLRRTAASIMASGGIPRLTIWKILNHVERSVTAVYDATRTIPKSARR